MEARLEAVAILFQQESLPSCSSRQHRDPAYGVGPTWCTSSVEIVVQIVSKDPSGCAWANALTEE